MIFGVTYAVYVGIVMSSMLLLPQPPQFRPPDVPGDIWTLSYGRNSPDQLPWGRDGAITGEYWPDDDLWLGLRPMLAVGLADEGGFLTFGVRKDFQFGPVRVTPHFGPTLYQSDFSNFEGDEVIQFRTGFDVSVPLAEDVWITGGFYHISNAMITDDSAEIDMTRIGISYRF